MQAIDGAILLKAEKGYVFKRRSYGRDEKFRYGLKHNGCEMWLIRWW